MREVNIKIDTIRTGQEKSYGDSIFEYIIEAIGINGYDLKMYCTNVLSRCTQTEEEWRSNKSAADFFRGYYEFHKLEDGRYRYFVLRPYND